MSKASHSGAHVGQSQPLGPRPRVKDVALRAGVSVGTVSNVLNRPEQVSPDVRARVEATIADLGYFPNLAAQALRTGVSPLVGVAILDITNPFFMEAAAGVERRLNTNGCVMALSSTRSDLKEESQLIRTLVGQGVRGILLTPTDLDLREARWAVSRGVPVVLFDFPGVSEDMSSIWVDDKAGASLAVSHLLNLGHRRIGFLNGPRRVRQAGDRMRGVEHAVASTTATVDLRVVEVEGFTAEAGRDAMASILAGIGIFPMHQVASSTHSDAIIRPTLPPDFPTAFFCANDLIAFGAMTTLRDSGVRIPQDVSLVGFDDISVAAQMSVPLTTVRQPMDELGWAAADMLLSSDVRVRHEKFRPELVVRASTQEPTR